MNTDTLDLVSDYFYQCFGINPTYKVSVDEDNYLIITKYSDDEEIIFEKDIEGLDDHEVIEVIKEWVRECDIRTSLTPKTFAQNKVALLGYLDCLA